MRLPLAQVSGLESDVVGGLPGEPGAYCRHIENYIRSGNTTLALLGSVRSTRINRRRCPCVSECSPRRRWWPSRSLGDWPGWPLRSLRVLRVLRPGWRPPRRLRVLRVLRVFRATIEARLVSTGPSTGRTTGPDVGPITGPIAGRVRTVGMALAAGSRWRLDSRPVPGTVGSGGGGVRFVPGSIPGRAGRFLFACPCVLAARA
jgi:hypothetical protein